MARNVEIKARVADLDAVRVLAEARATAPAEHLVQEDVFFRATTGRLKLRIFGPEHGELIAYERPDQAGPKLSRYLLVPTTDPAALREALSRSLREIGVVRKARHVVHVGQTRVHLDRVEGLDDHVELEVVLREAQSIEDGEAIAKQLMEDLGIPSSGLVEGAYFDLLHGGGA